MAKMGNKMIALCSAAVGAIYISGYTLTQPLQAEGKQPEQKEAAGQPAAETQAPVVENPSFEHGHHHHGNDDFDHDGDENRNRQQDSDESNDDSGSDSYTFNGGTADNSSGQDSSSSSSSNQNSTQASYKDGTYSGQGSNHIGSVEVSVKIKGGKISKVDITNCDTHYSDSYIQSFPEEVVQNQSAHVSAVSGATLSAEAFEAAVDEALAQAEQA